MPNYFFLHFGQCDLPETTPLSWGNRCIQTLAKLPQRPPKITTNIKSNNLGISPSDERKSIKIKIITTPNIQVGFVSKNNGCNKITNKHSDEIICVLNSFTVQKK